MIPSTIITTRQGRDTTDWEKKTMGDSWVIPTTRQGRVTHGLFNNKIDQNTNSAKLPSAKWLFLYKGSFNNYVDKMRGG